MADEKKPLLLVVTDDLERLTDLDSLLGRRGHRITTCSTSADAEKVVVGRTVDLVVVGKLGSEGDAIALIWKVKSASPGTKFIHLIDSPDWASSVAPLSSGADETLSAPYSAEELAECVERLLADRFPPSPPGTTR